MKFFISCLLLISTLSFAQKPRASKKIKSYSAVNEISKVQIDPYEDLDKKVTAYDKPANITELADFINELGSEKQKVRGIYSWITHHIDYDTNQLYSFNFEDTLSATSEKVFTDRKGVCIGFSNLFYNLCTKLGIKSYTISGYVKTGNHIGDFPHAWNAAQVDNQWYLFDATWGVGYSNEQNFVREPNDVFFMVPPGEFIYTHMPFDPLWQLLEAPITNIDFYNNLNKPAHSKGQFNYLDSLKVYDSESSLARLISSAERIEKNGNINSMTYTYLRDIKHNIDFIQKNKDIDTYNACVEEYQKCRKLLIDFIDYRKAKFTPLKSDEDIKKMLSDVEIQLGKTRNSYQVIPQKDSKMASSKEGMKESIAELEIILKENKNFLDKYFKAWKPLRKAML